MISNLDLSMFDWGDEVANIDQPIPLRDLVDCVVARR